MTLSAHMTNIAAVERLFSHLTWLLADDYQGPFFLIELVSSIIFAVEYCLRQPH